MAGIVLISPTERQMLSHAGDRPPLGLMYLSAALNEYKVPNSIVDLNHATFTDAWKQIKKQHPDYIGISIPSTPTLQQGIRLGNTLKGLAHIVYGGTGATTSKVELPGRVIRGPGENQLVDMFVTDEEGFDINRFPVPNRRAVDNSKYNMEINGVRTAPMVSARGCNEHCIFCGDINKKPQYRSIDNIVEELNEIKELGYGGVYLYNENFLSNMEHAEGVCRALERKGLKYRIEARGKDITRQAAGLLADTGCMMVAVGVECPNDDVLTAIRKGETVEDIERGFNNLARVGLQSKGYFMFGLPEQTMGIANDAIDFAYKLKSKGMVSADFYAYTPYPGSKLANNLGTYGIKLNTTDYDKFMQAGRLPVEPVIETKHLSSRQIKELVQEGNRRMNGK